MISVISLVAAAIALVTGAEGPKSQSEELTLRLAQSSKVASPWSATEWTVEFSNESVDNVPFGYGLLTKDGIGGVRLMFEVARKDQKGKLWISAPRGVGVVGLLEIERPKILKSGEGGIMQAVLHGTMRGDFESKGDVRPTVRFHPVFAEAGTYEVCVIYKWKEGEVRSNACTLVVSEPSKMAAKAFAEFKELAKMGLDLHVQNALSPRRTAEYEKLLQFSEGQAGTIYGDQMRAKLAISYVWEWKKDSMEKGAHSEDARKWKGLAVEQLNGTFAPGVGLPQFIARLRGTKGLKKEILKPVK